LGGQIVSAGQVPDIYIPSFPDASSAWIPQYTDPDMDIRKLRSERFVAMILLGMAATMTGCALFNNAYGPKETLRGGYEDVQIDKNTYRVRYYGKRLDRETAEQYLIYRCAELTLAQGYDYFVITDQSADEQTTSTLSNSTESKDASGTGISATPGSVTVNTSVKTSTEYNPVKTIKVFKGKKPEDNFKAYDGREVTATLAPKIEFRDSADAAR
jgi:hypothetical protein